LAAVALAGARPEVRKLRLGLFADAPLQPRWIVEAFDKVARSDFAEIALISVGGGRAPVPLLWRVYSGDADEVDLSAIRAPGCDADLKKHGLDVAFVLGDFDDRPLTACCA
jgi:hypothetical protein